MGDVTDDEVREFDPDRDTYAEAPKPPACPQCGAPPWRPDKHTRWGHWHRGDCIAARIIAARIEDGTEDWEGS